jgi:Smr domain
MARRKRSPQSAPSRAEWGSVYPVLDLHGHRGDEARLRAEGWLRARQADGERTVVVVTGRGNRSQGPPVLRGEILHLLESLEGSLVASFEPAEGGGGFRVQLVRPKALPSLTPEAERAALARQYDAALTLRAEEALWELGIAPTPALIRAEIRRILDEEDGGG